MSTFAENVQISTDGTVLSVADNWFQLIEDIAEYNQTATLTIIDMYPAANFTTGFDFSTSGTLTSTINIFTIAFLDDLTNFNIQFTHNNTETILTIRFTNVIDDATTYYYTLYTGTHPPLATTVDKQISIKLLNGFLWLSVGGIDWITKLDMIEHPLNLDNGLISYNATISTDIILHNIKNIYFEPIMVFKDDVYFERAIFAEQYENFKQTTISTIDLSCSNLYVNGDSYLNSNVYVGSNLYVSSNLYVGSNLYTSNIDFKGEIYKNGIPLTFASGEFGDIYLDTNDIVVDVPTGAIMFDMTGNTYINDPTFAKCGLTVNRDDYKILANEIGIPTSQTTFTLPNPTVQRSWVTPQFLFNIVPLDALSAYGGGGRVAGWWENNYTIDINCSALNAYDSLRGIFTAKIKGVYRFIVALDTPAGTTLMFKQNNIDCGTANGMIAEATIGTLNAWLMYPVIANMNIGDTFVIGVIASTATVYTRPINGLYFPSNFSGELIYSA